MTIAHKLGNRGAPWWRLRGNCLLCLEAGACGRVCQNCAHLLAHASARCSRCAGPPPIAGICPNCLREPPPFDEVVTAFDYRFPVDRLVRRFKFAGDFAVGAYLGDALAEAAAAQDRPDLLVSVPSSSRRLRERGFDPALLLARRVRRHLGLRLDAMALAKPRHAPPQTGLDRAGRRDNLRGAFAVRRPLRGLSVAVVDDVMTTGETLRAIAGELRSAGAGRVAGWVVARTPEPAGRP